MEPIISQEETSASNVMLKNLVDLLVDEVEIEVVSVTVIVVEETVMKTVEAVVEEAVVEEEMNIVKTIVDMKDATDLTSVNNKEKKTCSLNRCMITIFGIKSWLPHFILFKHEIIIFLVVI